MTGKTKREANLLLASGLILFSLVGCTHDKGNDLGGQTAICVEPSEVDLGAFELVAPQTRSVVVTVASADGNVHRLTSIDVSCSCMKVDKNLSNREVSGDKSLEISVEIELTHQSGLFKQAVRIVADGDEKHAIIVPINAYLNTPPRPAIDELVFRKNQASSTSSASILFTTYKPADDPELSVKSVSGISGITVTKSIVGRTVATDDTESVFERLEVELELAGSHDIGDTALGTLEFVWVDDVIPKVSIPVHLRVLPAIQVSPKTVYLGVLPVRQLSRGQFSVKSDVPDKLGEIQPSFSKGDAFTGGAIVEVESGTEFRTFEFQVTPDIEGRLDGMIILKRNDGETVGSVKFWGLVRE